MNSTAFLAGYLDKTAVDWFGGGNYNPLNWGASAGDSMSDAGSAVKGFVSDPLGLEAKEKSLRKEFADKETGFRQEMADKEKSIRSEVKGLAGEAEKKIGDAFKLSTAASTVTTLGTGLMNNMAAGSRHKELLKAIKGQGRQPINKPAAQTAFRLNRPVPGTAGRAR